MHAFFAAVASEKFTVAFLLIDELPLLLLVVVVVVSLIIFSCGVGQNQRSRFRE
jgi:hypothetical protein